MGCKLLSATLIFLLAFSRLFIQPVYSLISDCDETFNYWEPLNLLVRGFGKQTWEYSPVYSIRSWAFLLPFSSVLYPLNKFISFDADWNFYIIRALLGLASFLLECSLFYEVKTTLSVSVANFWLAFQLFSPGWFHSSVELLPSSVAMLLYLGSIKYALRYLSRKSTSSFLASITFNFIGGILGWPFVLILSLPLCLHYFCTHEVIVTMRTAFDCTVILSLITAVTLFIDSLLYGKFSPVSWNIFWYNVVNADEESGPNIFGVESWTYYVFNLLLNFCLPVLLFSIVGIFHKRLWPVWMSLTAWIGVFLSQPHKEERFLYPIYGLISLSAAVGFHNILQAFSSNHRLQKVIKFATFGIVILQAVSRIAALVDNYSAPLTIYSELYNCNSTSEDIKNVCTGREWYHFPNSFFLPDNHRLRFVHSGFDGLLPGDFSEDASIFSQVRKVPTGMNKKNIFDIGKLWPVENCDFYVDLMLPTDLKKDALDPQAMPHSWRKISCSEFIDVDHSKILGRSFYVPEFVAEFFETHFPRYWHKVYSVQKVDYCLFEKVGEQEAV